MQCYYIRPVQVIADGEDNITGRPVGADDVNYVGLFYRHL